MNGVKDTVDKRRMTVENAKVVCQNRSEWRAIAYGKGFIMTWPDGREGADRNEVGFTTPNANGSYFGGLDQPLSEGPYTVTYVRRIREGSG